MKKVSKLITIRAEKWKLPNSLGAETQLSVDKNFAQLLKSLANYMVAIHNLSI